MSTNQPGSEQPEYLNNGSNGAPQGQPDPQSGQQNYQQAQQSFQQGFQQASQGFQQQSEQWQEQLRQGSGALSESLPGATFMQACKRFVLKGFRFKGYASRSEFWWVSLAWAGVVFVINILFSLIAPEFASGLIGLLALIALVPFLALGARRLHDTGKSGLLMLLYLIPFVGWIVMLVLFAMDTSPTSRRAEWNDLKND